MLGKAKPTIKIGGSKATAQFLLDAWPQTKINKNWWDHNLASRKINFCYSYLVTLNVMFSKKYLKYSKSRLKRTFLLAFCLRRSSNPF
jgi:hypothetical protein